jgi:hypothetical protein
VKKLLIITGILCCLSGSLYAQQQLPTPIINTGSTPVPQATPIFPRGGRVPQPADVGFGVPGTAGTASIPDGLALRQLIVQKYAAPLYRKPTNKELIAIAPDPQMLKRFAAFLNQPNTGIFRLVADTGCAENSKVIDAREDCLKYTMPGAGNSYSFRTENYRIRHLADLTYSNGNLIVTGVLMHGILVRLGDLAVDGVTPQTAGMRYIIAFEPSTDFATAREADDRLIGGIESDGYTYKRAAEATVNSTYVLRAIAYDGKVMRAVRGAPYNEMDFDKRTDVTVAFRIVELSADGSITIIWKELSRADSPRLKVPANSDKTANSQQPTMKYSAASAGGTSGAASRCATRVAEITLCFEY